MNAVIDIGNTFVKLGFFEGDTLVHSFDRLNQEEALKHCATFGPEHVIFSSVSVLTQDWIQALAQISSRVFNLDATLPVPLINHYETPETLGTDRLAASVGAKVLYPADACLTINMGTCITYDYMDAHNNYWGGSISPGLRMRLRAMHTFTSRLPLLEPSESSVGLTGRNTRDAMLSGAINGMAAELDGIIESYRQQEGSLRILGCGGDAAYFERRIKAPIFVVSKLVLIGLNRILQYNLTQ
jgi:type III pantothenate kinase